MKPYYLFLFIISCLFYDPVFCQCNTNSNFATFCGTQTGGCPTFNSPCLLNWQRSHGSPQIFNTGGEVGYNYAYMWSAIESGVLYGEGLFATYSFFVNHTYTITVTAQAAGGAGSFFVYAATGLTEPGTADCGDPPPAPTTKQFIMQNSPTLGAGWQTFTINFVPGANYTQLWIFPAATTTTQYNFDASLVSACTNCSGVITYNAGVVPTGDTKAGDIYAGSSAGTGGSGTVTVSATGTTSLQAVNTVHFESAFDAAVTTGSFRASTIPCSGLTTLSVIPDQITGIGSQLPDNRAGAINMKPRGNAGHVNADSIRWLARIVRSYFSLIPENDDITVYPTPGHGLINITGVNNSLDNAVITVVDQSGQQLYQFPNKTSNNSIVLDLHFLNDGIYFIRVSGPNRTVTKKIIIMR